MDRKKIYSLIEKDYQKEGSRKFLHHLMAEFFPPTKVSYIVEKPAGVAEMICCISRKKLISKDEVFAAHLEIGPEAFVKHLQESFTASLEKKPAPESPLKEKLKDKSLAIGTKGSTKFLCQEAWEELANFMLTESLKGNQKINTILSKKIPHYPHPAPKFTPRPVQHGNPHKNNHHKGEDGYVIKEERVTTLGDLGVLQSLKSKLESEEK